MCLQRNRLESLPHHIIVVYPLRKGFQFLVFMPIGSADAVHRFICFLCLHDRREAKRIVSVVVVDIAGTIDIPKLLLL